MKRSALITSLVAIAMLVSVSAQAQWVFVARKAMGKIKQMQSDHADVAAVILEVGADAVYGKAISTIESRPNLSIIKKDNASRTVAFTNGETKAKMKVDELGDGVSEIMISAEPAKGGSGGASFIVERIMEVCKEVNVQCQLAKR